MHEGANVSYFLLLVCPQMGDKTLAQSAQMYHYQHQKQQMLSVGRYFFFFLSLPLFPLFPVFHVFMCTLKFQPHPLTLWALCLNLAVFLFFFSYCYSHKPEQKVPEHEITSDEEEVGGDFTVYECPGLAPVGRHTHAYTELIKIYIFWCCFLTDNHSFLPPWQTGEMEVKNPLFDDSHSHLQYQGNHKWMLNTNMLT